VKYNFPEAFQTQINQLLAEDAVNFWQEITQRPARRGLRLNPFKINGERAKKLLPYELSRIPWTNNGFFLKGDAAPGKHPYHAAGLYYIQEPSAMAPVGVLDPQPGEKILDLAAAPGGKSTQIASAMNNRGLLVCNDPNHGRLQALTRNLERWGVQNCVVLQESPQRLAKELGPIFDRVLVDAPCSGEGMFRAHPGEIKNWSENFVSRLANEQNEILWYAGQLVKPGGVLVYATCTFNTTENESIISKFLKARSDFQIESVPDSDHFSPGFIIDQNELANTVRIWPHRAPGEGHYIARLIRDSRQQDPTDFRTHPRAKLTEEQRTLYRDFWTACLIKKTDLRWIQPESTNLFVINNQLYALKSQLPNLDHLRSRLFGWQLGSFQKGRFSPSHSFAMGLKKEQVQTVLELPVDELEINRYLKGLTLKNIGEDSWVLITTSGFPVGWGKRKGNRLISYSPSWIS
jgi:NOL1/NOP2/sun family putative RNA methylase